MPGFIAHLLKPQNKWSIALIVLAMFIIAGLFYTGMLDGAIRFLQSDIMSFSLGKQEISAYKVLEVLVIFILLFWISHLISALGEKHFRRLQNINASNRTLLIKSYQIFVYFFFFMLALNILGIDLTTLAVFSGAVGIGVGVGLQKISSNFVSGFILLFEKAVEEGDLIELGTDVHGYVRRTSGRYTLIETFDGKEVMVPNEDFITNRVVNWTFSNTKGRISVEIGISYKSDFNKAKQLMLEAATENPRCSKYPEPECFLRKFGDNSAIFLLNFWVDDVIQGRFGPQSEVMFSIWNKFREYGIEIAYPQYDLHVKGPVEIMNKDVKNGQR